MKKWRVLYKPNFLSNEVKSEIIIAETSEDANNFFFDNYSGYILRTEYVGYVD